MRELYINNSFSGGRRRRGGAFREHVNEQFSRENDLYMNMSQPEAAVVIGLGGIGSHIADILSSFESMKVLILFDNDKVELSNLNRTCYDYTHIDKYKVECIAELVARKNLNCKVIPVCDLFNDATYEDMVINSQELSSEMRAPYTSRLQIFDCRDDDFQDHALMDKLTQWAGYDYNKIWRGAYNGGSITVDGHSKDHPCWGEPGYTVIPSHSLPSRLVALMTVTYACTYQYSGSTMYRSKQALTFESEDLIKHVHRSRMLQKMEENHPEAYDFIERFFKYYSDDPTFMKGKSFKYKKLPLPEKIETLSEGDEIDNDDFDVLRDAPEAFEEGPPVGTTDNNHHEVGDTV